MRVKAYARFMSKACKDEQHEAERAWGELRGREGREMRDPIAEETRLIKRLYNFVQSQPTPWNTLDLVEAAKHEFALTSASRLRVIISSLLIGLRLGVNELMDLSMAWTARGRTAHQCESRLRNPIQQFNLVMR